uniref:Uncharacterized protein n=1 Tax=Arundo donax TaxID=35708 RepID=A0A0A9EEP1_ARUDO
MNIAANNGYCTFVCESSWGLSKPGFMINTIYTLQK